MIWLGLLAGLSTFFAAGYGVTMLLFRGATRPGALECACLSWIFGTGAVSLVLWVTGFFASGLTLRAIVALVCVGLGMVGWREQRKLPRRVTAIPPLRPLEWALAGVIFLQVLIIFFASTQHTLGWDGLLNWEIKARYAFQNGGVLPAAYFTSSASLFSHAEYPLFIPMAELWLYLWMGEAHQFWVKVIFPIYYGACAFLLAVVGARLAGRRWPAYASASLLFFVPYLTGGPGGVVVGYVDFPLGLVYFVAIAYLLCFQLERENSSLRAYFVCLALLPWIKREGALLWVAAALCGAAVIWWQGKRRIYLLWLPASVLIWLIWRMYLSAVGTVVSSDFQPMTVSLLAANSARIVPILRELALELCRISHWSIFWFLVAWAFISLLWRARGFGVLVLFAAFFLPIAMYSSTYLFSGWLSYVSHIEHSLPRLLLQLVPLGCLTIALALPPPQRGAFSNPGVPDVVE